MDDEKQKQKLLAFTRKVVDGFPRKVEDLMFEEWPDDPLAEPFIISNLAETVRDESNHWRTRKSAFDLLQGRMEHYRRKVQSRGDFRPEDIPHELLAWSFQVSSGMVTPPDARQGQKTNDGDVELRDDKLLMIYEFLRREYGYKSEEAHEILEEVACLTPDGRRDALKRARKRAKSLPAEGVVETRRGFNVNIWGEEIP